LRRKTVNLQAFAVGNGLASYKMNDNSLIWFAYHHGLMDEPAWVDLQDACCSKPYSIETCNFHSTQSQSCQSLVNKAMSTIYSAGLNFYNLYGDCVTTKRQRRSSNGDLLGSKLKGNDRYSRSMGLLFQNMTQHKLLMANVPCIDSQGADIYLNRVDVQQHLHVVTQGNRPWAICSDVLHYTKIYQSMYDVYKEIFTFPGIHGLSYNGDTDMACNFLGNQWFVESLNLGVREEYQPWKLPGSAQVSGFRKTYDRFKYYTVKGAGHMVPQWRPDQALYILLDLINPPHAQRRTIERRFFEHLV